MKKELCPNCHEEMKVDKYVDETTIVTKCGYCHKTFRITYDEKAVPSNINSFSWGAFFLWHLWGFWNGMPILAILGCLLIPIITSIYPPLFSIDMAISLYLGWRGYRLSWQNKDWSSIRTFENSQKKWNIAGCIVALCSALFCIYILLVFLPTFN